MDPTTPKDDVPDPPPQVHGPRLQAGLHRPVHELANQVTVILGTASFLLSRLADDDPLRPEVEEIVRAAERAATLTRAL